jgi:hypothetical protein
MMIVYVCMCVRARARVWCVVCAHNVRAMSVADPVRPCYRILEPSSGSWMRGTSRAQSLRPI